jgi:dTDP-4-dehydrorhamnose reductase
MSNTTPLISVPTILVIGSTGQIGFELLNALAPIGKVVAATHDEVDLGDLNAMRLALTKYRPHIVVNAAAYTAVDQAEADEEKARRINAWAPGVLAAEVANLGGMIVHYSTDYVFDGSARSPYKETDTPNPINAYGRTKLEGEREVERSGAPYLILRTSWVFAARGKNFVHTILRLARERDEVRVVNDQWGSPTSAAAVARATTLVLRFILENGGVTTASNFNGIYHLTSSGQTTWYDFARRILAIASRSDPGLRSTLKPITSAEYPTPARRPRNSVLDCQKALDTFGVALPPWEVQLDEVMATLMSAPSPSPVDA